MIEIPGYRIGAALHQSRLRAVLNVVRVRDGRQLIAKTLKAEYPDKQAVAALRREYQIVQRLQAASSIVRVHALEAHGNGNLAIVYEPFGQPLAKLIGQAGARIIPLNRFFDIAIAIAEALGQVHEHEVVHKNIHPGSVLVDEAGRVRLIDFGLSSEISRERPNYGVSKRIEGSLPYISPEQTGRMNRDLDYRSDFYSLGVTLFELLTGELPFKADSVLEWVHSHIGKQPPSPSERDHSIPETVSAIVLKLMAKNAEDRYQSSFGLIADLTRCQQALADTGAIPLFALGLRDVSRKFQIPQKLYGREAELAVLMRLFDDVAKGATAICMVSGYSGIGKSALVNELGKPLVRQHGYLIEGKFDQFHRSTPYSALATAFRSLIRQLLGESRERTDALREKILAAVAPNAQLLVELMPDLALIIGPQPAVPELPRTEAQNRFQIAILNFLRVITSEQALVIFLDDLQFSDTASLNLIRWLAGARELSRLMLIGAYRSNEVDTGHPLRLALNEIQAIRPIHDLPLHPLDPASSAQLVADALGCSVAACAALSAVLHDKAQGNPFFLTEMLKALEQSRAISFSPEAGGWQWDLDGVQRAGLPDDVVDLVVANLRKLAPDTQRVLQLAACIGASFDLRTLAIIHQQSLDQTAAALLPALKRHMVIPLQDEYKLVGEAAGDEAGHAKAAGLNPSYRFQHDRVQQAAYALIDHEHKQAVHLSIGRLIQAHATPQERTARLIDIVDHLNQGLRLIDDAAERRELAALNLAAGLMAQRSSAYESALEYLRIGQSLLARDAWDTDFELAKALATEYQQCAYLTARFDEAEAYIEQLLARARSNLERAEILSMRTRQYATTGKMVESIDAAILGLGLLGIRITSNPDRAAIARERAAVKRNLAGREIASLIHSPPLTDPSRLIAIRLLMEIFPAAFLSGSGNLFPFLVLKSVNISLSSGTSPESAFAYAAYGMLLCGVLDDPATGYEYGQLAVAMNDQLDDIALKSRVLYVYTMFVHHWSKHWSSMTPWFRRGIESGYQSGDLLYLAYSAQDCIIWDPKLDLETAEQEHANYLSIVRDCEYQDSLDSGTLFLQMQRNFLGRTDGLCSMNDASFDEARCLEGMLQRRFMTGVANYHIYKAEICHFYGEYDEALRHVEAQDQLLASAMSLPQLVRFYIVAFLTRAALFNMLAPAAQAAARTRLRADHRRMARWAAHCPENFLHLQYMMEGELARLDGRVDRALQRYEQAMDAAREHEFSRDEAMANELAARHLLAADRRKAAEGYLRAARHLYERWGARRKVALLEDEFPQLQQRLPLRARASSSADEDDPVDASALDMASVIKASQAISSEIVLEQLLSSTMRIMLENAGGQRGCFVVRKDGRLRVEGFCEIGNPGAAMPPSLPIEQAGESLELPLSIIYHVLHTNTPVVLNDVTRAGNFARDAYLIARRPQSALCIPLQRQGKFEGAIYMENGIASGAFTEDRIEVIKLLAAQASISMENARLYDEQLRLIAAQRRFVPSQFLESLDHLDIARVDLGEHVAKTMSVMFADLRGFTPLAESLDPHTVIALLNRFFVSMETPIKQTGGFIDSFAGDEIKALFEATPDAAVRAGIGMWRALESLNQQSIALGQPTLQMGIGINSGPVVLGTVGGHDRIQCSVIGDTVNLASRIEQLTKRYRARLLIGEQTYRGLNQADAFEIRRVDRVAVKGKNLAIELYEVLDAEAPERREAKLATRAALATAMQLYDARDFSAALAAFRHVSAQDPEDEVPTEFIARCEHYLIAPPPAHWQGFERLTQK
ncbi:AAA family ATPase [Niveibacterium sp. 24ML]|uniref:AAA family ATPase n=1 Tax=Niveibacterium sp. 24ML TaxID=2985512 RepID=UPI00226FD166|nr:AAA family ATPase [Niveibacterium sp. 24ML]MCX9155330.1 AAA family ATPase [Niveibacterium sp. 24ML]